VALFAGSLAAWAVAHFVMETPFRLFFGPGLAIILGGVVLSLLAGLGFALAPMAARPARVLRARE